MLVELSDPLRFQTGDDIGIQGLLNAAEDGFPLRNLFYMCDLAVILVAIAHLLEEPGEIHADPTREM